MNLYEEIEKIKASGYNEQNAQSKLGQDIVLNAIADSGMARNATIKGGVVMRSITGDARRARVQRTFSDRASRQRLERSRSSNWIGIPVSEALERITAFLKDL